MTAPSQQKLKVQGAAIVTANRLSDGAVVYRTASGGWSARIEDAAVVTGTQPAKDLLAKASADETVAIGAYVAPVENCDGRIEPGNLRERIRLAGPTFVLPACIAG
jgi:hypothetical protein